MKRSLKKYPQGGPIKPYQAKDQKDYENRTKAYNDSLDLYNLNLHHVNEAHPDLGVIPKTFGFTKEDLASRNANNVKEWVANDLKKRIEYSTTLRANTSKNMNSLNRMLNDPSHPNYRNMGVINTLSEILPFDVNDIKHKNEHNSILENSLKTGILPIGLYNDHDVSFKKPVQEVLKPKYKNGGRVLPKYGTGATVGISGADPYTLAGTTSLAAGSGISSSFKNERGEYKDGLSAGLDRTLNPTVGISSLLSGDFKGAARAGLSRSSLGLSEALGISDGIFGKDRGDYLSQDELNIRKSNDNLIRYGNQQEYYKVPTQRNFMFKDGGLVIKNDMDNANAELELNEQFQLPDGQVGEVDGPSHEEGGIDVNLPEGTRVFSDKLKIGKRTIAQYTKPITNKISKLQDAVDKSPNKIKQNTIDLLNKQLDHYFNIQESMKIEQPKKMFRKGGMKYADGGELPFSVKKLYSEGTLDPRNPYNRQFLGITPEEYSTTSGRIPSLDTDFGFETSPKINIGPLGTNSSYADEYSLPATEQVVNDVRGYTPKTSSRSPWLSENWGMLGAAGSVLGNAVVQGNNINNLRSPRSISNITTPRVSPTRVDYSTAINDIKRNYLGAKEDATRSFSSASTAQAFKNKARLNEINDVSKIYQNQENTNAQFANEANIRNSDNQMKEILYNNEIDKYNMENKYNYQLFKNREKNKVISDLFGGASQIFNNQTARQSQLDSWNIYKNALEKSVRSDVEKKKFGGKIRTLKKK